MSDQTNAAEAAAITFRRVVTAEGADGRSRVEWDGAPANMRAPSMGSGRSYADLWIWNEPLPPLAESEDPAGRGYDFPGPPQGGHLRIVRAEGPPPGYDPAADTQIVAPHPPRLVPPGRMWDRGFDNAFTSPMHKTETVDYGIVLAGERVLVLDDCEVVMRPGDIVVQVGAWHRWACPRQGAVMAFDMMAATFVDGADGVAQGADRPIMTPAGFALPEGVRPIRRIVTIDREPGRSSLVSDGPAPDVRTDPARPGFASTRLWVTDAAPARIVYETLHLPHAIEPPPQGSVLRVLNLPPDETWRGRVGEAEVRAFFEAMGSPDASAYRPDGRHPYMQRTRTLDFCIVLQGEATLVLDTGETTLQAGQVAVVRGASHAWSNRSRATAVLAVASHDAQA